MFILYRYNYLNLRNFVLQMITSFYILPFKFNVLYEAKRQPIGAAPKAASKRKFVSVCGQFLENLRPEDAESALLKLKIYECSYPPWG